MCVCAWLCVCVGGAALGIFFITAGRKRNKKQLFLGVRPKRRLKKYICKKLHAGPADIAPASRIRRMM